MLSDIVNPEGTHIDKKYLFGTAQRQTEMQYPHQEKPPPVAWKKWRMAICQCFLGRAMSRSDSQLLHSLQQDEYTSTTILMNHRRFASNKTPLQSIFDSIPTQWREILGPVQWPEDGRVSIVTTLRESKDIHAYLDGLVAVGKGAHAYTIQPECETNKLSIIGTAPSPGDPETISSLCPEHYGGMSVLIWVWMLEQKFGAITTGCVHCHIENDTVVKRLYTKELTRSNTYLTGKIPETFKCPRITKM